MQIFGVEPHEGHTRDLVLGLKYGRTRQNARALAEIVVDSINDVSPFDDVFTNNRTKKTNANFAIIVCCLLLFFFFQFNFSIQFKSVFEKS